MKLTDSNELVKFGTDISKQLKEYRIINRNEFIIELGKDDFHKLDEDFYYRQNPSGTTYIPSDEAIILNFENLVLKIIKNG